MSKYLQIRSALQIFARQFDRNGSMQTPCGENISPTKAHAIMEIGRNINSCISQKDLALSLGIDKSNVTRLIQALEKAGFLKKVVSNIDKRLSLLVLTTKGLKLSERLEDSSKRYIEDLLSHIPSKKHNQLIEILEDLNSANALIKNKRGVKC